MEHKLVESAIKEKVPNLPIVMVYADEFGPPPEQWPYDIREGDKNDAADELHDQG